VKVKPRAPQARPKTPIAPERPARAIEESDFDPFADANSADLANFADVTAEFDEPPQEEPAAKPARTVHTAVNHVASPHYWTWRVLAAGFSAEECRQIRGLDPDTLFDHVLRAAREGQPIDATWLLTTEQLAALAAAVGDGSPARLKSVLARLPPGIKYRDVQVYLLSHGLSAG
jgi:hypothetical protein